MTRLRMTAKRVAGLFGRDRHDAELREELESLAALQLEDHVSHGMSDEEARRRVIARTGSITAVQEAVRERRGLGWLETLWRDGRLGVRMLRRSPVFASVAVASLGLGIGVNTAIFSIVDHLLLRPLPVQHAARLTLMTAADAPTTAPLGGDYTFPIYEAVRSHASRFDGVGAFSEPTRMTVKAGGLTARPEVAYVSGGFFELIGATPMVGRTLAVSDDVRGGGVDGPVAVVSARYFERTLGGDIAALARPIEIFLRCRAQRPDHTGRRDHRAPDNRRNRRGGPCLARRPDVACGVPAGAVGRLAGAAPACGLRR